MLSACCCLASALAVTALPLPTEPAPGDAVFPMAAGTRWTYAGHVRVRSSPDPGTVIKDTALTITMEVVETAARAYVTAALLRGHPSDVLLDASARPASYVLARLGGRKFYLVAGARVGEVWRRLRDERDELFRLLDDGDEFLEYPLYPGDRFGDIEQVTRPLDGWAWDVRGVHDVDLHGVEGVPGPAIRPEYELRSGGNTGYQAIDFVPGVGITGLRFVHFSSGEDGDLRLIAFGGGR